MFVKFTTARSSRKRIAGRGSVSCAVVWLVFGAFCLITQNKQLLAQESENSGARLDGGAGKDHPRRHFPSTRNRIVAFSDQIATSDLTEKQFEFAATRYAGAQKLVTDAARHLRQYNPNFLVLHYRLAEDLGYGTCDQNGNPTAANPLQIIDRVFVDEWPGDSVVQPQWFYPFAGFSRVYYCDAQHYLMNLDDPGWRAFYSNAVIQELKDNEDDAVFADTFSVPNYLGASNWTPRLPDYDPAFEATWAKSIHAFTDYMRGQFHGRWLWIPNVGSWVTTRDPTDYTNVDGAMIENFADYGNENFLATGDWVLQMNRALSLINLDKILIAQAYPAPWINNTDAINERLFILGSYLLVKGDHTYINLDTAGLSLQWWPEYQIKLGPPKDPLPTDIATYWNASWGVYVRHYKHGMILVNSTNASDGVAPLPITLDKTYYQVVNDGAGGPVPADGSTPGTLTYQPVNALTVCSDCAAILLDHPPDEDDR